MSKILQSHNRHSKNSTDNVIDNLINLDIMGTFLLKNNKTTFITSTHTNRNVYNYKN